MYWDMYTKDTIKNMYRKKKWIVSLQYQKTGNKPHVQLYVTG